MIRVAWLALPLLATGLPAAAATLRVDVSGIERFEGVLKVAICRSSLDEAGCRIGLARRPNGPVESFDFTGLDPGRYAVICYQDLNGNERLDFGTFGLPAEPYGLSNDVGRFAPPSFEAAAVNVGTGGALVGVRVATFMD